MLGSTVLEVSIGITLVFFFLAILSSAVHEALAGLLLWRSQTLRDGVERLLMAPDLAAKIHAHPLVAALGRKDGKYPSYLPAKIFALALFDALAAPLAGEPPRSQSLAGLLARIERDHPGSPLLAVLADAAVTNLESAQRAVARWFDDGMDRVSGWYARRARMRIAAIACLLTLGLNVDVIRIAEALARDSTLRAAIVAASEAAAKSPARDGDRTPLTRAAAIEQELASLRLPLGWKGRVEPVTDSIPGWILAALAASLGGPFWFDLLNKLVRLRSAGRPPAKEPET